METMNGAKKRLDEFALAKGWDKQTVADIFSFMEFAYLIGKHDGLSQMGAGIQNIINNEFDSETFEFDLARRSGALGALGDL